MAVLCRGWGEVMGDLGVWGFHAEGDGDVHNMLIGHMELLGGLCCFWGVWRGDMWICFGGWEGSM